MQYMYIIQEYIVNGLNNIYLLGISSFAIFCASLTVISKNPIISVLYLIGLFLGIAIYLILLGFTFIGLSYLLVYVGAVSILFLFIVMLINIRISELLNNTFNNVFLALIIISVLTKNLCNSYLLDIYHLYYIITKREIINNSVDNWKIFNDPNVDLKYDIQYSLKNYYSNILAEIKSIIYINWETILSDFSHITSIGNLLYTNYSIWLIIASIILLLAMVGAIVITIKPIRKED